MILLSKRAFFAVALSALLTATAHANIAPSSKPVAGENQMFPNAPAPKTAPAATPAATGAASSDASSGVVNTAVVAAAASSAPSGVPAMPQPPMAWLFILGTLSLAGLALSTRLVLRT